jgi:hypothetical protein
MPVAVFAVATIVVFVGATAASAVFSSDSTNGTHNSCGYNGYSDYNTTSSLKSFQHSWDNSNCSAFLALGAWVYDLGGGELQCIDCNGQWHDESSIEFYNTTHTTINVYGYHQIRQPSSSYSTTLPTRP